MLYAFNPCLLPERPSHAYTIKGALVPILQHQRVYTDLLANNHHRHFSYLEEGDKLGQCEGVKMVTPIDNLKVLVESEEQRVCENEGLVCPLCISIQLQLYGGTVCFCVYHDLQNPGVDFKILQTSLAHPSRMYLLAGNTYLDLLPRQSLKDHLGCSVMSLENPTKLMLIVLHLELGDEVARHKLIHKIGGALLADKPVKVAHKIGSQDALHEGTVESHDDSTSRWMR